MVRRVLGLGRSLRRLPGGAGLPRRWALGLDGNVLLQAHTPSLALNSGDPWTVELIWTPLEHAWSWPLGFKGGASGPALRLATQFLAGNGGRLTVQLQKEQDGLQLLARAETFSPLELGELYHLSITWDGVDDLGLYINGALNMQASGDNLTSHSFNALRIGARNDGNDPHEMVLYQFRAWDVLRSAAQIEADVFKRLSMPQDNLLVYFAAEEGSGAALSNLGSHPHDGVITGGEWRRVPRIKRQPVLPVPMAEMWVSQAGNDDWGAGTETAPFRSIGRAMASMVLGSKVHLERGSHWREQLELLENDTLVDAYGDAGDPMPLLDCSDPVTGGWEPTDGWGHPLYTVLWDHEVNSSIGLLSVWVDGQRLAYRDNLLDVWSEPGTFLAEPTTNNPAKVHLHPPGSTDPRTDGKLYEITRRDYGCRIPTATTGCVVEDLHTRRNGHNDGSLVIGRDCVARRCLAEDGTKHNALMRAGSTMEACVAWKAEDAADSSRLTSQSLFVAFDNLGAPEGETCQWIDCWAVGPGTAFLAHTDGVNDFTMVRVQGGGARGPFAVASLGGSIDSEARDLFAEDVWQAFAVAGATLTLDNVTLLMAANGQRIQGSGNVSTRLLVRDVRALLGSVSGASFFSGIDGDLEIESSVIAVTSGTRTLIEADAYPVLDLQDTVLSGMTRTYNWPTSAVVPTGDGNVYARDGVIEWVVDEETYTTLGDLQAAHPTLDPNSARVSGTDDPGWLAPSLVAEGVFIQGAAAAARQDGRAAGSSRHIPRPRWDWMENAWSQGFLEPIPLPGDLEVENAYAATPVDTAVLIDLAQRSRPSTGNALALHGLTQPADGSVTPVGGTLVEYTPPAGFQGLADFSFTLADGPGGATSGGVAAVAVGAGASA
jgi:hypothetical protein